MKHALLVMVHGTPRPESNRSMFEVVDLVRATERFDPVEVGFLDINEPDIPTALERCVAAGASTIVCVPYFLHAGRHVRHDIPAILAKAQEQHPEIVVSLGDFIGARPELGEALADRFRQALDQTR